MFTTTRTVFALTLLAAPALAQASLTPIKTGPVNDVSADGMHVAGQLGTGGGYLWHPLGGETLLKGTDAVAVDLSGTRAFGNLIDPVSGLDSAGLWTMNAMGGGTWKALGGLPGTLGCSNALSVGYDFSDKGDVATGLAWEGCKGRAFRWITSGGMKTLPALGPGSTRGNAVSGNGQYIGGWDEAADGQRRAAIWLPDLTEILPLEGTAKNPKGVGEVWAFSTDGTFAVGSGDPDPFIYSKTGGVELLAAPVQGNVSEALGVSDDGETVVGWEGGSGPFGLKPHAWIWRKGSGTERIIDVLAQHGLAAPPYDMERATDCSSDGRTIVGSGLQVPALSSNMGWVLRLPKSPWDHLGGGTIGANGVPNLTGQGSLAAGSAGNLHLEGGAASAPAVLVIAVASTPIPLFGGTLHAFPFLMTQSLAADANGEADLPFTWPGGSSSGDSITFQIGVIDLANPFSVALSNGLTGATL